MWYIQRYSAGKWIYIHLFNTCFLFHFCEIIHNFVRMLARYIVGLGTNHIWGSHRDLAQKIRGGSSINLNCCNEPKSQPNSSCLLLTKTQTGYHNLMINHEKLKKCLNLTRIFLTHSKPTKNAIYIINIRRINLFLRNVYT